jgi:hypothetical protein
MVQRQIIRALDVSVISIPDLTPVMTLLQARWWNNVLAFAPSQGSALGLVLAQVRVLDNCALRFRCGHNFRSKLHKTLVLGQRLS